MLCFSVIGCQKDIGENEVDLKAKKDKDCNNCKVLYLPVTLIRDLLTGNATHDSTVFKYCDKIKEATTLTTIYNFEYKNPDDPAELVHWTVGESSTGIEYSNKNYWAKDIKNKELLFVIGLRQSFLPIKKEVLNSDYYSGESNWTSWAEKSV